MRIRKLSLRNIKLLADQTFSFERSDGSIRNWTVFLGDNGVCKTTILKAIALASSGDRMARALVEDANDYLDVSNAEAGAALSALFEVDDNGGAPRLQSATMAVKWRSHAFDGDEYANFFNRLRDTRAAGYWVAGYGVGRRLAKRGEVAIPRDPVSYRVQGLFDGQHKMLGVDFYDALRDQQPSLAEAYADALAKVLRARDVQGNALLPWLDGGSVAQGAEGMRQQLQSRHFMVDVGREWPLRLAPHLLSQGYQSTFAWIADLLGQAFLDVGAAVEPAEMTGIVLLDEIDLHLHPSWQRRLVPILRAVFPKLQFIVTSHSPLVLTGFEADEVIRLALHEGQVVQTTFRKEPGMQSASELMEEYFGVPTAGRPELVEEQLRYTRLLGQERLSTSEQQQLDRLGLRLKPYLASTDLADVPAPDDIAIDAAEPLDRELWRKQLLAMKASRRPSSLQDEESNVARRSETVLEGFQHFAEGRQHFEVEVAESMEVKAGLTTAQDGGQQGVSEAGEEEPS